MALVAEFEKKDKDPEIVEEGGPFFGRPLDFAMDKYNYYMCFKCQKPYFGGERACGGSAARDPKNPEYLENLFHCFTLSRNGGRYSLIEIVFRSPIVFLSKASCMASTY